MAMGRDVCAAVAEEVTVYFLKPNSSVGEEEEDFVSVLRGANDVDSVNDFAAAVRVKVNTLYSYFLRRVSDFPQGFTPKEGPQITYSSQGLDPGSTGRFPEAHWPTGC